MNKEKVTKSDRYRRPQPNVSRPPSRRVPPKPPNPEKEREQPLSAPTSIFGSLRRLKGAGATSTPKKPATFYADFETTHVRTEFKEPTNKHLRKKSKKEETVIEEVELRRVVDNNANVTSEPVTAYSGVNLRRKGKENVHNFNNNVDSNRRVESRRVAATRPTIGLSRDKVKSSASVHSFLRNQPKPASQSQTSKPKRPATITVPSNISVRRGHKEGQGHPDNLSRTSSITNLDSLEASFQGQGKGAKPRKVASKERIDKQGQDGGKKVTKNNNKLEPPLPPKPQPLSYSSDSLQETELQQLRKQLRDMADEKSSLALQLGEQRGQLNVLQKEILKLKSFQEESSLEMEKLSEENTALRNRLRDVAHSPLSDNEKQQLLFESRHHSSAPASIATNIVYDNGGDVTTCTTPDWDKHSSGNVSEVSVACLQDKINQMQETHYSTNEELQATLQELTDLQRQLTELQQENERLNEEKTLMFDSLCRQTERLNDSRQEVENLKQLLYRDRSDDTGINQFESVVEREQKLVELLRSAQEEREQLLLKLEQIQVELHESRTANIEKTENIAQLTERVRTLECTLDAKHAEHKQLDQELAQAKDQCSGKQIEINRLSDLLENARTKINELEQDRTLSDKSELDELLDNARKEKDQLESEVTYLKEQLARSKNEIEKLKEQVLILQEECKVTRNNAKTTQSDLEYKCEKLVAEKNTLGEQLQQFQEAVNELQVQAQCHLEDKRQLSAVLSETQRNMSEAEQKNLNLENELQELKKLRSEENDEWEKFQNDLLTSVRVANDFKTEAQQELQKIILENKTYRERVRLLEGQVEKFKGEKTSTSTQTDIILTPQIVLLARNLDPLAQNRLSLLEHWSASSHDPASPSSPTSSMEKLFPGLGREKKGKSRENLTDISTHRSSEASSRRQKSREGDWSKLLANKGKASNERPKHVSKSKEDIDVSKSIAKSKERSERPRSLGKSKGTKTTDETRKDSKPKLKKSKSKDDLTQYAIEISHHISQESKAESKGSLKRNKSEDNLQTTSEVDSKDKGSRGFLKWNKSKDNLEKHKDEENLSPTKEKRSFFKRKKSEDDLDFTTGVTSYTVTPDEDESKNDTEHSDKPRKSLDSMQSSDSNQEESKPEFFSKFIKKRDKKPANRGKGTSHTKFMSVEEELLLKSLDNWYENIDQSLPDELLSEEDRAVKRLKTLFEDEMLKEKPVAHKPKEHLAISKPLLNSVVLNPKLERIFRDPTLRTVDPEVRQSALEEVCSLINEGKMEANETDAPQTGIHKSRSLDDVNVFEEYRTESELEPVLYRAAETENLTTEEHIAIRTVQYNRMSSDIQPIDSVSNPRCSRYHYKELPKPNIYINYENLDEIVDKIPKNVPENKLSEEQKFALKLKHALDDAEKKNSLKKTKKKKGSIRGLEISAPTLESVQKNWKLKEIILNPGIKRAQTSVKENRRKETEWKRHSTDISSDLGSPQEMERHVFTKPNSKSYEDISFSFVPENTLLNLYYGDQIKASKFTSETSSSSQSFTSGEFNLDTGNIVQNCAIPDKVQHAEVVRIQGDENEDLLYNETINKVKSKEVKEKKQSTEALAQLKKDLSNEEEDTEDVHHPKIRDARERYKIDVKEMLKRIEHDELRKSLRKQRLEAEARYQMTQSQDFLDERPTPVGKMKRRKWDLNPDDKQQDFEHGQERCVYVGQVPIVTRIQQENVISHDDGKSFQSAELEDNRRSIKIEETGENFQVVDGRWVMVSHQHSEHDFDPNEDYDAETRHLNYMHIEQPNRSEERGSVGPFDIHFKGPTLMEGNSHMDDFDPYDEHVDRSPVEMSSRKIIPEEIRYVQKLSIGPRTPLEEIIEPTKGEQEVHSVEYHVPQLPYSDFQHEHTAESIDIAEPVVETYESTEKITIVEDDVKLDKQTYHSEGAHEYWTQTAEAEAPQTAEVTEEYGYKQILKENQYGVTSPLDLRFTYRTLVQEYKSKYHPDDDNEEEPKDEESDESGLEYSENFIDDFFKPIQQYSHDVDEQVNESSRDRDEGVDTSQDMSREDSDTEQVEYEDVDVRRPYDVSQIDKEMDDIMDRYLHTRASLLVKKIDTEKEDKSIDVDQKSNLRKYDNFENLQEIDNKEQFNKPAIVVEYNDSVLEPGYSCEDDNEPLSLQDIQFIEEMKLKYASADTISTTSEKSLENPELEMEVEEKHQHAGGEEMASLKPPKIRKSRPLSEINEKDLLLIEEVSKRTLADGSEPPPENNLLSQIELKYSDLNTKVESDAAEITHIKMVPPPLTPTPILERPSSISSAPDTETNVSNISIVTSRIDAEGTTVPVLTNEEIKKTDDKKVAVSMIAVRKDARNPHLPPSLRPKRPVDSPPQPPISPLPYVVFRDKQHRYSSQESPTSPGSGDRQSSKRLSDLMFKETIFVPMSKSPEFPGPQKYKQDNTFKESIFVTSLGHSQKNLETPSTVQSSKIPTLKSPVFSTKTNKYQESPVSTELNVTPSKPTVNSEVKVSLNKYSTIPQPKATSPGFERNSWRASLNKGLLDNSTNTYEPVYSNVQFNHSKPPEHTIKQTIIKKPLAPPQESSGMNHLAGTVVKTDITLKNDVFDNMNDSNENFSGIGEKDESKLIEPKFLNDPSLSSDVIIAGDIQEDKPVLNAKEIDNNVVSQEIILEESKAHTDILRKLKEPEQSKKLTEIEETRVETTASYDEKVNRMSDPTSAKGHSAPVSSSEAGNAEDNETKQPSTHQTFVGEDDIEEIPRRSSNEEPSKINLFEVDSHSSYDSYLELFRSKESKDFDNLRGKKSPPKGFFGMGGFAYVEEIIVEDEGSSSNDTIDTLADDSATAEAKPKVVDFVPLDDKTTPVFTKKNEPNYDTLEREKTFHVLGQAAKMSGNKSNEKPEEKQEEPTTTNIKVKPEEKKDVDKSDMDCSLEVLARKSSSFSKSSSEIHTTSSRTSFTQAKKLFEALAEANKVEERPKSAFGDKPPSRWSVRDSRSLQNVKPPVSVSKEGVSETGFTQKFAKDEK